MSESTEVDAADLPETVRLASTESLTPRRERRRRLADDLYSTLVDGHYTFWGHIHPLLLKRDITRHDLRQLVSLGSDRDPRQLPRTLEAVRHGRRRLQALHELPRRARVHASTTASSAAWHRSTRAPSQPALPFDGERATPESPSPASQANLERSSDPILAAPDASWILRNARHQHVVARHLEPAFDRKTRNRGLLGRAGLCRRTRAHPRAVQQHPHVLHAFAIDVAFVDRDGQVASSHDRRVRPWRAAAFTFRAFAVVELAAGVLDRDQTLASGDRLLLAARIASSRRPSSGPHQIPHSSCTGLRNATALSRALTPIRRPGTAVARTHTGFHICHSSSQHSCVERAAIRDF